MSRKAAEKDVTTATESNVSNLAALSSLARMAKPYVPASKRKRGRPVGSIVSDKTERLFDRLQKGTLTLIDKAAIEEGLTRAQVIRKRFER